MRFTMNWNLQNKWEKFKTRFYKDLEPNLISEKQKLEKGNRHIEN